MTVTQGQPVAMVCHRGANRLAPENTLASARAAFDLGAAYVEIDVRQSSDGELVVFHDATVDRTTDGRGPVVEKAMADIEKLDAGSWFDVAFAGERVPKLAEVLDLAKGRGGLYIEIKDADVADVVEMTQRYGMLAESFFWSGDSAVLEQLHGHGPAIALMIRRSDYDDLDEAIRRFRPAVMEFCVDDISAADIQFCKQLGTEPMLFYPGSGVDTFRRSAEAGITLFNLDEPSAFEAAFRPRV
ncbi:MAG: glycerophosphodiester phosphodiesterase family protein [Alphaproteobacteria bacterium]